MDRRSWLWRRKSSDKSPGETESSGSLSSHSERFSDDQAYSNLSTQSPEVTSKVARGDEELNDSEKTLAEKLSAALLNISAKEDLVKQHTKVAEEAVEGWEKAENEVSTLKQQLEAAAQKNSALEDRVSHLDGALKECVRQLRQAREDQEQKVHEVVAKKTHEWESTKSALEAQVFELQGQLETAKTKAASSIAPDLRPKLEASEKVISNLKFELLSRTEELELRAIERDLSTQAAEAASKQHLESIKKVAKLEAECRRLKSLTRKISPANDHKSCTASSTCVESFTDSQSDCGERLLGVETDTRKMSGLESYEYETGHSDSWASALLAELDQFKNDKTLERNFMVPSTEMNLLDDFLEMEKLAASPEIESRSSCLISEATSSQPNGGESPIKAELDSMIHRVAELEEKLAKMEADKVKLEMDLSECQQQLQTSQVSLTEEGLKLAELKTQLAGANKMKKAVEGELEATNAKRETAESQLSVSEAEVKSLLSKLGALEDEVEKEKALSAGIMNKCQKLEDELSKRKLEADHRHAAMTNGVLKVKQEKELAVAASKLVECQQTIASLGRQLKSLATLEDFLTDSEKSSESFGEEPQHTKNDRDPWKQHSGELHSQKFNSGTPKTVAPYPRKGDVDNGELTVSGNQATVTEKNRNGFGKLFSRNRGGSEKIKNTRE